MRLILGFVLFGVCLPVLGEEYVCNARNKFSDDSSISYSVERDGEDFLLTRAMFLDETYTEEPGLNTTKRRFKKPSNMLKMSAENPYTAYFVENEFYLSLNILNVLGLHTVLIDKKDMSFESSELYGKDLESVTENGFCFLK